MGGVTLFLEGLISMPVLGFLTDVFLYDSWIWKKLLSPAVSHPSGD